MMEVFGGYVNNKYEDFCGSRLIICRGMEVLRGGLCLLTIHVQGVMANPPPTAAKIALIHGS